MRTIIIGDVHGCSEKLNMLLDSLRPDSGEDRLVFLGDLFDRGQESWEVFQTVRRLAESFGERFVLLRGNHEDYLLRTDISFMDQMVWVRVGKRATEQSFHRHGARMEDSIPWISEHVRTYYKAENYQCVHAGAKIEPLEANDLYTLLHDHSIAMENGYAGFLTITGHIALKYPVWFAGDRKTVKTLEYGVRQKLPERGLICIDTGCGKGGELTAMTVEGDSFILTRTTPDF